MFQVKSGLDGGGGRIQCTVCEEVRLSKLYNCSGTCI